MVLKAIGSLADHEFELKDGLHRGLSFDRYCRTPRVNQSFLSKFRASPAHARMELLDPEPATDEQHKGTVTHIAVLEPEYLKNNCIVSPKFDKRYNTQKLKAAAWEKEFGHLEKITHNEWELCKRLREAVYKHKLARSLLLDTPGTNEITACWTDEQTQFRCKGRVDRFCRFGGQPFVIDFKTTNDSSTWSFSKSLWEWSYHLQAAFYLDGLNVLSPADRRFVLIVVEKKAPWCVQVFEIEDRDIQQGRREYERYLERYQICLESNQWPGYSTGIVPIGLPNYARDADNRGANWNE